MATHLISLAAVRRALLDRGLTLAPRCPQCRQTTDPKAFTTQGICKACDVAFRAAEVEQADARIRAIDTELLGLWARNRECPSEALDAAMHALECERQELAILTHPEELTLDEEQLGPDGLPLLPRPVDDMFEDPRPFLPSEE